MAETGMGRGKRKGSVSTPRDVPSNFSAVVVPVHAERRNDVANAEPLTTAFTGRRLVNRNLIGRRCCQPLKQHAELTLTHRQTTAYTFFIF